MRKRDNPGVTRTLLAAAAAYALGCLVGAYYVVRLRAGHDVRTTGSGNAGARNVLRSGDKVSAALTLLWDVLKGVLAVWIARALTDGDAAVGIAFVAVVLGHVWPAQLAFHGGKGAATALGCMLAIDPRVALAAGALGALAGVVARSATAGGLIAIAAAPVVLVFARVSWSLAACVAVACTIVLIVHHPVIDRRRRVPLRPAQENAS